MTINLWHLIPLVALLVVACTANGDVHITDFGAKPNDDRLDTAAIQAAIDACSAKGNGAVIIPAGKFISGALKLRDKTHIRLEKGAVLQGSADWHDYGKGGWIDSFMTGEGIHGLKIEGPGIIDGADCSNPAGEEGFRGPHIFHLDKCSDISFKNLTIRNSSNYAIYNVGCTDGVLDHVTILAGHDGLHAQACRGYRISHCDFRTGDDCVAGCDSQDFRFENSRFSSSCNAFRFGCLNLVVRKCSIQGPGEYPHRVSHRNNMLSAFEHFAPEDRHPKLPSDQWLIEDVTIKNVERVYSCDFERGLWQTGQPPRRLRFHRVNATEVVNPLHIIGDKARGLDLTMDDCSISMAKGTVGRPVMDITTFGKITLSRVKLENDGTSPALHAQNGGEVILDKLLILPDRKDAIVLEKVDHVKR